MTDYDYFTEQVHCNFEETDEYKSGFCTNPINEAEEIKKISWLDDYGWI